MRVRATVTKVGKSRLNLLPDVETVQEVVPRRRRWQAANKLDGLGLNVSALRDSCRHDRKLGPTVGLGNRIIG